MNGAPDLIRLRLRCPLSGEVREIDDDTLLRNCGPGTRFLDNRSQAAIASNDSPGHDHRRQPGNKRLTNRAENIRLHKNDAYLPADGRFVQAIDFARAAESGLLFNRSSPLSLRGVTDTIVPLHLAGVYVGWRDSNNRTGQ